MYESPIEKVFGKIQSQIIEQDDKNVMCAVKQEVGYSVDKNELIKALKYDREQYEKGYHDGLNADKWIPVSERLPNNDEDVLACYLQGSMEVVYYRIDDTYYPTEYMDLNETGWFNENDDAIDEPIAWMPLPAPYEPQEKRCSDCKHYGKLSLDCGRCDDDCSMFESQGSER